MWWYSRARYATFSKLLGENFRRPCVPTFSQSRPSATTGHKTKRLEFERFLHNENFSRVAPSGQFGAFNFMNEPQFRKDDLINAGCIGVRMYSLLSLGLSPNQVMEKIKSVNQPYDLEMQEILNFAIEELAQSDARRRSYDFAICPDQECAANGGGTFLGTFCDCCGRDVVVHSTRSWSQSDLDFFKRQEEKYFHEN